MKKHAKCGIMRVLTENSMVLLQFKYGEPDKYNDLKLQFADWGIRQRLRSNSEHTMLKVGQQGKHILGHNDYKNGRSSISQRRALL